MNSPLECAEELEAKLTKRGYRLSAFDKWAIRYLSEFRHEFRDHCNEELTYINTTKTTLNKIDIALFDPLDGIVNVRAWLTRIFFGFVALITSVAAILLWAINLRSLL